jgi:TetR/AcrR family tetracycline transcriptional repressor
MALERDLIVRTALRLLDEVGLEALSLRRLAKELDVHASALYWHFRDKQDLLDAMARSLTVAVPESGWPVIRELPWDELLTATGQSMRRAMLAHRDGPMLITAARPADYHMAFMEILFGKLEAAGFSAADAAGAFFAVSNYVLGAAIEEHQAARGMPVDELREQAGAHPALLRAIAALESREALFENGLRMVVDGLRARLPSAPIRRPEPV